ncbi:MAG: endonuclease, partial [Candidatus Wallbacteria bacterium]|nr:endonuclease [Candidatus Wallbacteria bacterium]
PIRDALDELVFFSLDSSLSRFLPVERSSIPEDAFSECAELSGDELRRQLFRITGINYKSIPYTTARRIIFTQVDNHNNVVEDLYTARQLRITDTLPDASDVNIEHTWPQSLGAVGVAKSDMHHLFPCDSKANNVRANYPFGTVPASSVTWSVAGSKYANGTFEPRDQVKGDVARAMFYFAVRYEKSVDSRQEETLRAWNTMDPPDQDELTRMQNVSSFQNNSNPFVLHPEFIDRIQDF